MTGRTFEQWVQGIFDHPVADPAWYWADDAEDCVEPAEVNVGYVTRLFRESDKVLSKFDNAQVNQGLNFIVSSSCSIHASTILGDGAPWPMRRECIRSIYDVYAKCFAKRCQQRMSHKENPLNYICYMWWEVFPAWVKPEDASGLMKAKEYIGVMERCLTLSHDACLYGSLHGLGHWQMYFPKIVEPIIDRFLREHKDLRSEVILYAQHARKGMVQ